MTFLAEMEAMMAGYVAAFEAKDAAGCAEIYAQDTAIYSPFGPPVIGRAAISAEHHDWFKPGEENKRVDIIDCTASDDLGYCLIAYPADVTDDDGTVRQEVVTNLCAMVRQSGTWQITQSSMNETFAE